MRNAARCRGDEREARDEEIVFRVEREARGEVEILIGDDADCSLLVEAHDAVQAIRRDEEIAALPFSTWKTAPRAESVTSMPASRSNVMPFGKSISACSAKSVAAPPSLPTL